MIDDTLIPFPPDAPEAGSCVRLEELGEGLAKIVLEPPHRSLAVLDGPLLRDFSMAVDALERRSDLKGVILTGRSPTSFAAGADIDAIANLTDQGQIRKLVTTVHAVFARFAALPLRKVAAVGGPVPGGAFELTLCCDLIVLTNAKETRIGLPETQLGIVPGFGGCHRLPARVGLPTALQAILTGRLFPAKQALKLGLVDRLAQVEDLERIASELALGQQRIRRPRRGFRGTSWSSRLQRVLDAVGPFRSFVASKARKSVLQKTRGHYPAPLSAIDLAKTSRGRSATEAADREADATAVLVAGRVAKNLVSIFLGSEAAKKLGRQEGAEDVGRIGVIGAGVMGAGIASLGAGRGVDVRLSDLDQSVLDQAELRHRKETLKRAKKRRTETSEVDRAIDRFETGVGLGGFAGCDLVVEAVAERLEVKRAVFSELAEACREGAILATNTSSLSVDAIASKLPDPGRIVGLHFFNPVAKMPLVEVVRGSRTRPEVVATVCRLAVRLGKTPVPVADVPGFLVNRVLGPYLDEAARLFDEGADIQRVDRLMLEFGMPMGPFALLDEVGLDVAAHAGRSMFEGYGERMQTSLVLGRLLAPERMGRKTGLGFFKHGGSKPVPASDLNGLRELPSRSHDDDEIVDRLVLALCAEAVRALDESVVETADQLDLAVILGTGFAPFRGGPLRYLERRGLSSVVSRLKFLAESSATPGRFLPPKAMVGLAESGGRFERV
ncbi:MAG: 3-hydroxyacyl-CoA dehydrogenase NAD-binding domain-containing protein [Planctomycetota bacterium]